MRSCGVCSGQRGHAKVHRVHSCAGHAPGDRNSFVFLHTHNHLIIYLRATCATTRTRRLRVRSHRHARTPTRTPTRPDTLQPHARAAAVQAHTPSCEAATTHPPTHPHPHTHTHNQSIAHTRRGATTNPARVHIRAQRLAPGSRACRCCSHACRCRRRRRRRRRCPSPSPQGGRR
jgi:hypothetical protein